MRYRLDPMSPTGISPIKNDGFVPYFAGGPGKPSLVDSVNGRHGAVVISANDTGALAIANNLSDLANAATARTNLGLGSGNSPTFSGLTLTGAGDVNGKIVDIISTQSLSFAKALNVLAPNITNSQNVQVSLGQAISSNNAAEFAFRKHASNSQLRLGLNGNSDILVLSFDGSVMLGDGPLVPASNLQSGNTIGSTSLYWSNLYAQRLNLNSTAYIDGATAGQMNFTGSLGSINHYSGASVALYNTVDQTTNFEQGLINWNSNVFKIATNKGGTGNTRIMRLASITAGGTSESRFDVARAAAPLYRFEVVGATSLSPIIDTSMNLNASSGTQTLLSLTPTITQTSSAGYSALLINPTETGTGSGAKNLILAQVGGVDKFAVSNIGKITVGSGVAADSGGIKHKRVTTGSVAGGSTALVTVTWDTAFADANYTVQASVVDSTTSSLSLSVVHVEGITANAVTVRVLNNAVTSLTGTLHITGVHD